MSHPPLSFEALRAANRARVPLFKNAQGGPAHAKPDGSDWSPAQWLRALVGELGEFARVRQLYEAGVLSEEDYQREAAKELADVQCYLDLLSMRSLDRTKTGPSGYDSAQVFQGVIAALGEYANWTKKSERGDLDPEVVRHRASACLDDAQRQFLVLRHTSTKPTCQVVEPHPQGVALGDATRDKFNEVSIRVGAPVFLGRSEH